MMYYGIKQLAAGADEEYYIFSQVFDSISKAESFLWELSSAFRRVGYLIMYDDSDYPILRIYDSEVDKLTVDNYVTAFKIVGYENG